MAVTKIRGNTQIMANTITNTEINDSASIALTKTDLNANSNKIINISNGTDNGDAVNLSQLLDVSTAGKAWKEVIFSNEQLVNGAGGGIFSAQALKLSSNLIQDDIIYLNDGTNTETFTFGAGTSEISIGVDIDATLANLETAIDAGAIAISAVTGSLSTIDDTNNVIIIWQDAIGEDTKLYVNDADTATRVLIAPTSLLNMYEADSDDMTAAPTSLPGATNFGFSRLKAELVDNETHMCRECDASFTWDADGEVWNLSGAVSIPYASKTEWGKVKIDNGLDVTTGVISVDAVANQGIVVAEAGVGVDYDNTTIGIVGNKLAVKASGIANSHIANSTITMTGDSGTQAVDLGDTFNIAGGSGITTTVSGDEVTVAGDDAAADGSTKGVATFLAADFDAASGVVSLDNTVAKTLSGDTGSASATTHNIQIAGTDAQGIDTSATGSVVTVTAKDATAAQKGVASFSSDNFLATSGAITIKDGGVANVELDNSTITMTGDSGTQAVDLGDTFNTAGGSGITTTVSGDEITIAGDDAAADGSTKGVATFLAEDFDAASGVISLDTTVAKTLAGDTGTASFSTHSATIAGTDAQGIDTSATGTTVTITAKDATDSQKGVAKYSSDHFTVTSGNVVLATDGIDDTLIDWGVGSNQVNAADVPIIDTNTKFTATDVEAALEEVYDTQAAKYVFKTISVSGQSDVVADTVSDTLTLAAGNDIVITTDAGTDTVTISATDTIDDLTGSLGVQRVDDDFRADYDANAGLTLNGNDLQVNLDAAGGLEFNSSSGIRLEAAVAGVGLSHTNGVLAVVVDDASIYIDGDTVKVKADGILDSHINWGTGATEVDLDDVPDGATNGKVLLTSLTGSEVVKLTDASGDDMTVALGSGNRVLTLNENLTLGDGQNLTLTANGGEAASLNIDTQAAARTLDMSENLAIMDGQDIELKGAGGEKAQLAIDTQNAERTLEMNENLTIGNGADVTITAVGAARTLTMNESLTVGDGNDGTITYSAASKTITIEDDSIINQDLSTDSTVATFATCTTTLSKSTTFDTNVAAAGVTLVGTTLSADGTDANIDVNITPKGTGTVNIDNLGLDGNTIVSNDANGDINLTPNGTGEVNITKVDIDDGTMDSVVLGGCTIATTDINVTGQTFTINLGGGTAAIQRIVKREIPNEATNGAVTDFSVDYTPISGSEDVFLNGILQNASGNDYTLTAGKVCFGTAPLTNDVVLISYLASN